MSVRLFCNVVYARLAAGCAEKKDREALDRDLYAPLEGWAAQEDRMWARVLATDIGDEGGGSIG